ncbi:MAG TPA: DUF2807 domain-containing protein, partial [Flavobacterium sp.]|nr:DUF2807 domain-containing protein [Flavobacterium sp.]
MKKLLIFILVTALLVASSCTKDNDRLSANGDIKTETRMLSEFNGVQVGGTTPVKIVYGAEFKVEVQGSSNLLPYFETKVIDKKLYPQYKNGLIINKDDISVTVTLPQINRIAVNG